MNALGALSTSPPYFTFRTYPMKPMKPDLVSLLLPFYKPGFLSQHPLADLGHRVLPDVKRVFTPIKNRNLGFFSNFVQNDLGVDVNKLPHKIKMKVQIPLITLDWLYKKWKCGP
ncbi:MAG: hypothetical protein EBZ47_07920 [Chlamydiae bacterium]|jgi:hypothetical protein|nr:hypothetical protein [Chlamydiota bacterium]NDD99268.1 hypothetical protein [bacterium]